MTWFVYFGTREGLHFESEVVIMPLRHPLEALWEIPILKAYDWRAGIRGKSYRIRRSRNLFGNDRGERVALPL